MQNYHIYDHNAKQYVSQYDTNNVLLICNYYILHFLWGVKEIFLHESEDLIFKVTSVDYHELWRFCSRKDFQAS